MGGANGALSGTLWAGLMEGYARCFRTKAGTQIVKNRLKLIILRSYGVHPMATPTSC